MIEINQLEARRVLAHPADIRDLYTWDINVTGFRFKDEFSLAERSPRSVSSRFRSPSSSLRVSVPHR
jgi:hypothetical protein